MLVYESIALNLWLHANLRIIIIIFVLMKMHTRCPFKREYASYQNCRIVLSSKRCIFCYLITTREMLLPIVLMETKMCCLKPIEGNQDSLHHLIELILYAQTCHQQLESSVQMRSSLINKRICLNLYLCAGKHQVQAIVYTLDILLIGIKRCLNYLPPFSQLGP